MRVSQVAKSGKHEAMDAETVADLLGVSTRQLNNYIHHKGLPSSGSGRSRSFVWCDVLEWFVGYRIALEHGDGNGGSDDGDLDGESSDSGRGGKEDIRAANLRKTRAEANLKELQLGRLRGQVISIPDAKTRLDRMMGNLRAKLLSLAPKLASRIEGEKTRTTREAVIKEELENLCREISTGAVVDLPVDQAEGAGDVVDELAASAAGPIYPHVLGYLLTIATQPEALREANALVRAARDLRDQVKGYFRARV